MKLFLAADIHGSAYWTEQMLRLYKQSQADKLYLLGDIYNHGPRNPFPQQYAPMQVAQLLNAEAYRTVAVAGNCDSDVDRMISDFPFVQDCVVPLGDRRLYLTHGHVYNKENLPKLAAGDVLIYGHFHRNEYACVQGVHCINLSSVSLPKDKRTYCIVQPQCADIFDFDGNPVLSVRFQ